MASRACLAWALAVAMLGLLAQPTVAQDAADEQAVSVLVLAKEQLLETPGGFAEFCAENAGAKRRALRGEVVTRLKALADASRPGLIEALAEAELADVSDARPLWLVNGVVVRMKPSDVEAARALDEVLWVYPAGRVPTERADDAPDKVQTVLKAPSDKPFKTRRKEVGWHLTALGVPKVWEELEVTGEGALIVSYDHGLNYEHHDLRDRIWRNPGEDPTNGKDDDGNGLIDDVYGWDFGRLSPEVMDKGQRQHGTLTSCLAVGDGSSGTITGVAPRARLMPVRAIGGPYLATLALQYAVEQDGDVLSMSFSIPNLGHARGLWRRMAEHATCAGLVLVSGAGNFRGKVALPEEIRIPEGIPCVVCVGGVNRDLTPSPISSRGPVEWESVRFYVDHPLPDGLLKPDVAAFPGPALPLVSTTDDDGYLPERNGRRGNSLSAPQAAGVCALMLSANPDLLPWDVQSILRRTARDLPPEGHDAETGAGLIDAYAAVKAVLDRAKSATTPR